MLDAAFCSLTFYQRPNDSPSRQLNNRIISSQKWCFEYNKHKLGMVSSFYGMQGQVQVLPCCDNSDVGGLMQH